MAGTIQKLPEPVYARTAQEAFIKTHPRPLRLKTSSGFQKVSGQILPRIGLSLLGLTLATLFHSRSTQTFDQEDFPDSFTETEVQNYLRTLISSRDPALLRNTFPNASSDATLNWAKEEYLELSGLNNETLLLAVGWTIAQEFENQNGIEAFNHIDFLFHQWNEEKRDELWFLLQMMEPEFAEDIAYANDWELPKAQPIIGVPTQQFEAYYDYVKELDALLEELNDTTLTEEEREELEEKLKALGTESSLKASHDDDNDEFDIDNDPDTEPNEDDIQNEKVVRGILASIETAEIKLNGIINDQDEKALWAEIARENCEILGRHFEALGQYHTALYYYSAANDYESATYSNPYQDPNPFNVRRLKEKAAEIRHNSLRAADPEILKLIKEIKDTWGQRDYQKAIELTTILESLLFGESEILQARTYYEIWKTFQENSYSWADFPHIKFFVDKVSDWSSLAYQFAVNELGEENPDLVYEAFEKTLVMGDWGSAGRVALNHLALDNAVIPLRFRTLVIKKGLLVLELHNKNPEWLGLELLEPIQSALTVILESFPYESSSNANKGFDLYIAAELSRVAGDVYASKSPKNDPTAYYKTAFRYFKEAGEYFSEHEPKSTARIYKCFVDAHIMANHFDCSRNDMKDILGKLFELHKGYPDGFRYLKAKLEELDESRDAAEIAQTHLNIAELHLAFGQSYLNDGNPSMAIGQLNLGLHHFEMATSKSHPGKDETNEALARAWLMQQQAHQMSDDDYN